MKLMREIPRIIFLFVSALCLILTLDACATFEPKEKINSVRNPAQAKPIRYPLDAHVHYSFRAVPGTSGQDIFLKQAKFDHAFLIAPSYLIADVPKNLAFIADDRNESLIPIIHKEVSDFVVAHPGRFTGLCGLNLAWKNTIERTLDCLRLPGMRGIKLHSNNSGLFVTVPENRKKLEDTLNAVAPMRPFILWHTSIETKVVYELARQFPAIIFIIAHAAAPFEVEQWAKWMEHDGKLENLWLDVSLSWTPGDLDDFRIFDHWREFGFNQIVFGSDIAGGSIRFSSFPPQGLRWLDIFESQPSLTDAEKKAVLVDNPERLLQLIRRN